MIYNQLDQIALAYWWGLHCPKRVVRRGSLSHIVLLYSHKTMPFLTMLYLAHGWEFGPLCCIWNQSTETLVQLWESLSRPAETQYSKQVFQRTGKALRSKDTMVYSAKHARKLKDEVRSDWMLIGNNCETASTNSQDLWSHHISCHRLFCLDCNWLSINHICTRVFFSNTVD